MVITSIMPIAAEEISDTLNDNNTVITDNISDTNNDETNNTGSEGKGSFDVNEPEENNDTDNSIGGDVTEVDNNETENDLEEIDNTEITEAITLDNEPDYAPMSIDDDSTEYPAADCLDTTANANKYWQAYYNNGSKYAAIPSGNTISLGTDITLKGSEKKKDAALVSVENWSGKVKNSGTFPASVGKDLMSPGYHTAAVKAFIAPKSGKVKISQLNTYTEVKTEKNQIWGTNNSAGVTVAVYTSRNKTILAPQKINSTNGGVYAFPETEYSVEENEILYFDVRSEADAGNKNIWVHWNPVVTYTALAPTVESLTASGNDFEAAELDQTYSIKYRETLTSVGVSNVKITGKTSSGGALTKTPKADEVSLSNNTITIKFANLERGAKYTVTLHDLVFEGRDDEGYEYTFEFTTVEPMTFASYQASKSYSASKNTDEIWRQQYSEAGDKYTIYTDLHITSWHGTEAMVYGSGTGSETRWTPYTMSNGGDWRLAIGKYVMVADNDGRSSSTKGTKIAVRTFTAPSSGYVEISAIDPQGLSRAHSGGSGNQVGASISIKKSEADKITEYKEDGENKLKCEDTTQIWPEDGSKMTINWNSGDNYKELEPFTIAVNKGDKLHFEAEVGGNWWGATVYWDPVVTYKVIFPEPTSTNFEDGGTYAPNYTYEMEFDKKMTEVSASDITIDGGANVKSVEMRNGGKTIAVTFGGLKENTDYKVTVGGLIYDALEDKDLTSSYSFGFTTGKMIELGEVTIDGSAVSAGKNTVTAAVNNSGDEMDVTLVVCVMKGTKSDYTVETVKYVKKKIGAHDSISADVNVDSADGQFVRALLVDSVTSLKPYAEAKDFSN